MKLIRLFLTIFISFTVSSCMNEKNYFPMKQGKNISYDIYFTDKENKKKILKQNYIFLKKKNKVNAVLRNDGHVALYTQNENGVIRQNVDYLFSEFVPPTLDKLDRDKNQIILKYPIEEEVEWEVDDKTTIQMKLGYDRFYNTNLPFKLKNKIVSTKETISIRGKKIKNCIKISGYGKTSYYPDPTLGNINIEIFTTTYFAKGLGLVKYTREEKSDSETMGKIIYEKTINL